MRSANRNVAAENFRSSEAGGWVAVVGVEANVVVADVCRRERGGEKEGSLGNIYDVT